MKYTEPGTYKIQYTAEDGCGKTTVEDRTVIVEAPPRTVLYKDGTFIINELSKDRATNEALHGGVDYRYEPMLPDGSNYVFTSVRQRPWDAVITRIKDIQFGSEISPVSLAYWFTNFRDITFNGNGLDTSNVVNMEYMFSSSGAETLDLSMFETNSATNMSGMFWSCYNLKTIYVGDGFDVSNVIQSEYMFDGCSSLIGGAGTATSGNPKDKTYARIDNPPTAPGYFTAKE